MTPIDPDSVHVALHGVTFPASPTDLIRTAVDNGAPDDVVDALRSLPDRPFAGPDQVGMAINGRFGECDPGP